MSQSKENKHTKQMQRVACLIHELYHQSLKEFFFSKLAVLIPQINCKPRRLMANIYHSDQSFSRNVEKKEKQTEKVRRVGWKIK